MRVALSLLKLSCSIPQASLALEELSSISCDLEHFAAAKMTSNGPDSPIGDKGASVRRHNTVGGSAAGRLRQLVEQRAHASPSSPPNESTTPSALSESPLYAHLDQKLHRHASLPSARGGAESWSARRARAQTGPQRLAEDGEVRRGTRLCRLCRHNRCTDRRRRFTSSRSARTSSSHRLRCRIHYFLFSFYLTYFYSSR